MIDWSKVTWTQPPVMARDDLRDPKKVIDGSFREFSRAYGESLENFFYPLLKFLAWLQHLLLATRWPLILLQLGLFALIGSRSWKMVAGTVACFLFIGWLDMWEDTLATLAIISVATLPCIAIGITVGIWMARSNRVQSAIVVKGSKPAGSISLDQMIAAIAGPKQGPSPEQRYR